METRPPDGPAPLQPSQPAPPHLAELDRLGDQIAELSAHLEAATARLLALIREFDARGGWSNGFRSCAEWLAWRVGLAPGAAREHVQVARALGTLPALAEAMARGELSYAKVRALTRIATPETEARLLAVGRAGTAVHVESIVRGWRRLDRQAEAREAVRQHASRALHVYQAEDGTVVLRGRLTPEVGTLLLRALDAAHETLYQRRRASEAAVPATDSASETPTRPQQQADALALLAQTALHHELDPGAPGERYQVVVHVDGAVLANAAQPGQSVLEDGPHVPAGTSQRLACDASRVVMRHDADDPPGAAAGIAASGQELPLPGLQCPDRRGASRAPLGPRWPDETIESGAPLPPASPGGARRGLPARATARRRAPVPTAGRPTVTGCPGAVGGARRSGRSDSSTERRAGAPAPSAHGARPVVRGTAGRETGASLPRRPHAIAPHGTRSSFRNSSSSCFGTSARSRTFA